MSLPEVSPEGPGGNLAATTGRGMTRGAREPRLGFMERDSPQGDGLGGAAALAALVWQIELGADEAIGDAPVSRFDAAPRAPAPQAEPAPTPARQAAPPAAVPDPAADVRRLVAGCADLAALAAALDGFDGSPLRAGARRTVFADGDPAARVMVIGEAPGREEDQVGRPFVGRSGALLDRMLAAIGLDRKAEDPARGVYLTNVLPWRPLANRDPAADDVAALLPFLERHVELARPEVILLLGNAPMRALLETGEGIMRARGRWRRWRGAPVLPTLHPAGLLRSPERKRLVWRDLLALSAVLEGAPPPGEGER